MATDNNEDKNKTGANSTTPPGPKEPVKEDEVSISKKTLKTILDRLEANDDVIKQLQEKDERKDKEIEKLLSISDKGRLARYEQSENKGNLIRTARVSYWNGDVILGWTKGKDEVGFRDGRLIVNQTIKLFLDKGEDEPKIEEVDYLYWVQNVDGQQGEVIEKIDNKEGNFWIIQMKDGKKVKLDIRFINAF